MWATKLLISPVKKRIFCPKTTKFGPKLAVLVNFGQTMQAYLVPCCRVGWWLWRAGCISQDTYLLYVIDRYRYSETKAVKGKYVTGVSCNACNISHICYIHSTCCSCHWVQLFQVRAVASKRKVTTTRHQKARSTRVCSLCKI